MITVLGTRRVAILVVLLILNAVIALITYGYLIPDTQQKQRQLSAQKSQASKLQGDIAQLRLEFDQLDSQKEKFSELEEKGFFNRQSRRSAQLIFEKIQTSSGVSSAKVSIASGKIEDSDDLKKIGYKLLSSEIRIDVKATTDLEIFRYMHLLRNFFPGHISVDEISLKRDAEITPAVLRAMSRPIKPSLTSANVILTWRTIIPQNAVVEKGD